MGASVAVGGEVIDLAAERPFRVGAAQIDPTSREASFQGGTERIQPQNLKVLIALARNRESVVTRDQLIDLCWDGRFIGDDVINRAISTLRQFAERVGGFMIETVPRAGYRLVETAPPRFPRLWLMGPVLALVLGAAFIGWMLWPRVGGDAPAPTIAILPFSTASADPLEHELASDARDALAQALLRSQFHVALVDKASQHGRAVPDFVASADVSSNSDRIVIAVNVNDAPHDIVVYSHRFEAQRFHSGDLPEQVGAQVAGSLGWTASLLMLERNHPADPALTAGLFDQSGNYETSLNLAPRFPNSPIAHIALAYGAAYQILGLPNDQRAEVAALGRQAAARARELAPRFGGNEILWCLYHNRSRISECEDHLRAGLRYDPDSPWLTNFLADRLKDFGRTSEALRLAAASWSRDPYQMQKIGLLVRLYEATGHSREAQNLFQTGMREWPNEPVLFWDRSYGMLDRGDFAALGDFVKSAPAELAPAVSPAQPVFRALAMHDLVALRQLCPIGQQLSFKRDVCMLGLAHLGDFVTGTRIAMGTYSNRVGRTAAEDERLWLESLRYGDTDILMGPGAAPLRRDPRYLELAHRLGALDYWRSGRLPDFCLGQEAESICSQLGAFR